MVPTRDPRSRRGACYHCQADAPSVYVEFQIRVTARMGTGRSQLGRELRWYFYLFYDGNNPSPHEDPSEDHVYSCNMVA